MNEDNINNQSKVSTCPFCGTIVDSNACPECNIFIDDTDNYTGDIKKENKKEDEEEEYDWREHKR